MPRSPWERKGERVCVPRESDRGRKRMRRFAAMPGWSDLPLIRWKAGSEKKQHIVETERCFDQLVRFWHQRNLKNTHKGEFLRQSKIGDA